jgi:hypothetical protein
MCQDYSLAPGTHGPRKASMFVQRLHHLREALAWALPLGQVP